MKIYPILSSDIYSLSCVPVSMLDQVGYDELYSHLSQGRSLKFLVAQYTDGQVKTDTGYVSKHIEYADISSILAENFNLYTLQRGVASLSDYVKQYDLEQLSVVIDGLPRPYIISAFFLSGGHISGMAGYALSDALTSVVPKLNYTSISAESAVFNRINSPIINSISSKIPPEASEQNQLADKEYVSAMVHTNASSFRGTFGRWTDVPSEPNGYREDQYGGRTPAQNDFMVVQDVTDYTLEYPWPEDVLLSARQGTWRFGYIGKWEISGKAGWTPEYRIEQYNFTPEQIEAIDSGINSGNFIKRSATQVGNSSRGVFLNADGYMQAMEYDLNATVPSNAKFTDTIYDVAANGGLHRESPSTEGGTYKFSVLPATRTDIGGIKVGNGLTMAAGTMSISTSVRIVDIESYSELSSPEQLSVGAFGNAVHAGSIMIIRRGYRLSDGRQYTGYVYTGSAWEAMGGNCCADNVILPSDIPFSGSWSQVGNIANVSDGKFPCGGKSVSEAFGMIFGNSSQATIVHAPARYDAEIAHTGESVGPFERYSDEIDSRVEKTGDLTAIATGDYVCTLSLPAGQYVWSTGGSNPIDIHWSITA